MRIKWIWLVCLVVILNLQGCYVIKQGVGQFRLRCSQVDLEEAIESVENERIRHMLSLAPEIKQFAVETIHLQQSDNYTSYYATDEEGVVHVVTAAPRTELKPYTWWFPIVGSVPYKGFFDRADALDLKQELDSEGYDTWMFSPAAYSTLGWFEDPITTPMLKHGYFSYIDTIIHEMVHSTLYIKGQGDFNEQLASFVGFRGALQFVREKALFTERQVAAVLERRERQKRRRDVIRQYIEKLEQLYETAGRDEVLRKRRVLFDDLSRDLGEISPHLNPSQLRFNNARLLQYKRYDPDPQFLTDFWEESGRDWGVFWERVRQHVRQQGWDR